MAERHGEATGFQRTAEDAPRRTSHANGSANGSANGRAPTPAQRAAEGISMIPDPPPVPVSILAIGQHSLCGTAMRAFCLGVGFGVSVTATLALLLLTDSGLWRLPFFISTLAVFHFLEFYITARYNTQAATLDAFLLTSNGTAYNIAHVVAALETTVMHSLLSYPVLIPKAGNQAILGVGLCLLLVGQLARSTAMAQAGTNFNHLVQSQKRRGHELVTTGIYAVLRHPSYFGFFWWAIGGQLILGNAVSLTAYIIVLWRFFSWRIRGEERLLVKFFGDEYEQYRERTYTGIPFIS